MKFFELIQNILYKVVESLTIKVDVTKFLKLIIIYLQEYCMGVEAHNDSKELVGGL
jgi:anaerobic ribonucleoside-triphosphate reductase